MRSKFFVYVALATDMAIAITKFIAAAFTGSSAMFSEGIHSVIDCVNQGLLLLGINQSKKTADAERPFGYGRELYFWSFVVSLLLFSIGGCLSVYEGILRLKRPAGQDEQVWSYAVLAISMVFTIISLLPTLKKSNKQRGERKFFEAILKSKDPSVFIILLGDLGDVVGLVIAFFGVFLGHLFHNPYYDGIASMLIGLILIAISILLVRESRSLLMGEPVSKETLQDIIAITEADASIEKALRQFSMNLSPEEIVLQSIAVFKKGLNTQQITEGIQRVRKSIQEKFPRIRQIYIQPSE